jgi:hypothetical protein
LLGFRTILHGGANLIEKVQALFDLALRIGWIRPALRRDRLTGDARVPRIPSTIDAVAIGPAATIHSTTSDTIPHLAGLATSGLRIALAILPAALLSALTTLLSSLTALLTGLLTGLPLLSRLSVARELTGLILLSSWLSIGLLSGARTLLIVPSAEAVELIPQAR